jgi:peptidoglycan/LPS O-acetylase OafA/YrhL
VYQLTFNVHILSAILILLGIFILIAGLFLYDVGKHPTRLFYYIPINLMPFFMAIHFELLVRTNKYNKIINNLAICIFGSFLIGVGIDGILSSKNMMGGIYWIILICLAIFFSIVWYIFQNKRDKIAN